MTLIINIPEEEYNHLKRTNDYSLAHTRYIREGVPLDKIKAEIIELRSKQNVGVLECLDIIDKYKAESEG